MRFRPQPKRRGGRGQPWCWLGLAATGRPLVLSREWERTAPLARATGKSPSRHQAQPRPTIPRATRAAHRCRPAASGQQAQHLKFPHAAPARKQLASRSARFRPQTKRRGARGQPWCCLVLAATGRPLVLSRERERTPCLPAHRAKAPRTPQVGKNSPACPPIGQRPRIPQEGKPPLPAPRAKDPAGSTAQGNTRGVQNPPCPPCIFRAIVL